MISKKENEVLILRFEMPEGYDWFEQRFKKNKNRFTELRRNHMIEMKKRGIMVSQIARVYYLTRQRAHQIINGQ